MINKHVFIHHLTSFYITSYTFVQCVGAAPHVMRTCINLVMAEIDEVIHKKFR